MYFLKQPINNSKISNQMKLYLINIFTGTDATPDDDENLFLGVFDSKAAYTKAIKEFGENADAKLTKDDYEVIECELNKSEF